MKVKVTGERYLVKQYEKKEETKGGIFIPSSSQEERMQGVVIDIGEGALLGDGKKAPMFCNIGDTILFTKFAGTPIEAEDKSYLIINQRDVLAIVTTKGLGEEPYREGKVGGSTLVLPIGERYILKQYDPTKKTTSGIVLPTKAAEKQYQGTVIAVGEGIYLENGQLTPMDYKVGQSVLFSKFAGTPITVDEEEFLIVNQRDILCVAELGDDTNEC